MSISTLKTQVYEACLPILEEEPKKVFHQTDIIAFDIIPGDDLQVLLQVTQKLCDEKLFKIVHDVDGMGWKLRSQDEAKKYRSLTAEQEIVFSLIDESGSDGLWSKTIKIRTNLHDAVFRSSIKVLETKGLIQEMKSVEHPTRKMYIRAGLRASERATGGPWFSDGELDEEFIEQCQRVLLSEIINRSFWTSRKRDEGLRIPRKVLMKMSAEEIKKVRAEALGSPERKRKHSETVRVPFAATYNEYPTLEALTLHVEEKNVFQQTLTSPDILQLLEILVFDDKIERVTMSTGDVGFKALRKVLPEYAGPEEDEIGGKGVLSEVPCGRCPVFELCEEGGPVSPANCAYYEEWLGL